jgi:uncharacterized OB-fold protein
VSARQQRPVVAGLFEETAQGPQLLGARCSGCGTTYFPRVATCRNPACDSGAPEAVALERRGVLYSYTIQHYRPPALFRVDDWSPYAIGLLEFPEGIRVMGMLRGVALDAIRIGETYVLASTALYRDEEGCDVRTHVFERDAGATS